MSYGKASIIIRTKNEERWIKPCLEAVMEQSYDDWEVILVDNESTDKTVEKARQFDVAEVVTCHDFAPGKAINMGVRASDGDFVVCLSGHCIPVDEHWLENLARNFEDPDVAGVYGRQEPLSFTPDTDKRDLNLVFGKDRVVQTEDNFFHNANSMVRRELWEKYPFDEEIESLEDRLWAKQILEEGYSIVYEPEASVYHYHGIHHNGDEQRAQKHVRVLKDIGEDEFDQQFSDPEELEIVAIVPSKGPPTYVADRPLVSYTVRQLLNADPVDRIVVSTDDEETATEAERAGASVPFLRDPSLSEEYVDIQQVLSYTLEQLEERDVYPDLIVLAEPTFPFRPTDLFDQMITQFVEEGPDTLVAGHFENKPIFTENDGDEIEMLKEGITPRKFQNPTYTGLRGLGSVITPDVLRHGDIYGHNVGIYAVDSPLANVEVRAPEDVDQLPIVERALEELDP